MTPSTTAHSNSTRIIMLSSQISISSNHQRFSSAGTISKTDLEEPYIPEPFSQQLRSHHRGHSLGQLMDHQDPRNTNPGNGKVSTNTGLNNQHTLREAQTQDSTRPGHKHFSSSHSLDANLFTAFLHNSEGGFSERAGSPEARQIPLKAGESPPTHLHGQQVASPQLEVAGFFMNYPASNNGPKASQTPTKQTETSKIHTRKLSGTEKLIDFRQISVDTYDRWATWSQQFPVAVTWRR